jgi:hypothetical protein
MIIIIIMINSLMIIYIGTVNLPHINRPIFLFYDSDTSRTLYNISWNPPQNAINIDIDHYEIDIGSLTRSTSDTYMVVDIMSNVNISVNVSVVDRCNRRNSTVMISPPVIPDSTVTSVGKVKCIILQVYIIIVCIQLLC